MRVWINRCKKMDVDNRADRDIDTISEVIRRAQTAQHTFARRRDEVDSINACNCRFLTESGDVIKKSDDVAG